MMAIAAKVTIAEVEHLVDVGELDGDVDSYAFDLCETNLPGELYERRIQRRTGGRGSELGENPATSS